MGLITLLACGAALLSKGYPTGRYAQDFVALLDGGYRIHKGLVPHVDFSVPFGSLILFQAWLALRWQELLPPFATLQLTTWFLLAPPVLVLAARQTSTGASVAVVLMIATVTLVPFVVESEPIPDPNYNAVYNRAASAAFMLVCAWVFAPKRSSWPEGALIAWLLFLCAGWKIPHLAVALALVAAASAVSAPARGAFLRGLSALAAALLTLDLATGGLVRAYGSDIADMLRVNAGGTVYFLGALAIRSLPALVCMIGVAGCLVSTGTRPGIHDLRARPLVVGRSNRRLLLATAVVLAVLGIESQGTGNLGLFPAVILALGPLSLPRREGVPTDPRPALRTLSLMFLVAAAFPLADTILRRSVVLVVRDGGTSVPDPDADLVLGRAVVPARLDRPAAAYARLWAADAERAIVETAQSSFAGGQNATEPAMGLAWAREVALMQRAAKAGGLIGPATRVATIGYVEPFSRILGTEPARGTKLWLDPWRTVGRLDEEEARSYLRDADAVFVQRCPLPQQLADMIETSFRPVLKQEFLQAAATHCYELWVRDGSGRRSGGRSGGRPGT